MSVAEETKTGNGYVGRRLRRKEDPRLITGRATYVDDINLTGQLWAAFVRSPEAHAKIASIDASAARAREGVRAVYTGEDIAIGLPTAWVPPGIELKAPEHPTLAKETVNHVGDPVAMVIGDDRYAVIDAAEDVIVEYDPLPVVVDPEQALTDETLIYPALGTNKVHEWSLGGGDLEGGFAEADVIIERRVVNHRMAGAAIEPRGVLAEYRAGQLTVWSSTQVPHFVKLFLAVLLDISEDRVRAIAPEVGGAFGSKLQLYAEEVACAWASRALNRPVKWIETRSEGLAVTHHGRDQIATFKIGAKRDGTITALHSKILADLGAYQMLLTGAIPPLSGFVMSGVYKIPAVQTDVTGVMTNKFPTDAIRGAGRPEATHLIEVCMDQLADELGMDRLELRRKNFIQEVPAELPHRVVYDSGNYDGTLDRCLEMLDLDGFRAEQEQLRSQGVYRGVGFSTYVEVCGFGPSRALGPNGWGMQGAFFESAQVRVHPTGTVTVYTGTSPHGQGLETSFAQIVADRLGVSPEDVDVIHGDTNTGPFGIGTYGSRSLAVGGEAIARATAKVVDKAMQIVARNLEAAPEDIEFAGGQFQVLRVAARGLRLADVANHAYTTMSIPEGMEAGLEEIAFYDPSNFVWPFGAHAVVVEVDVETGNIAIVRYIAVDDCGPAINPMLIEGQVHGGAVAAIGQALYEQVVYNEDGQLVTGTFVDYALPTAAETPHFETDRTETPSPTNSLGVKGVGEAGTIACSPAIVNAVRDALRPLGVSYIDMPLTPMRVWGAIQKANGEGGT